MPDCVRRVSDVAVDVAVVIADAQIAMPTGLPLLSVLWRERMLRSRLSQTPSVRLAMAEGAHTVGCAVCQATGQDERNSETESGHDRGRQM